MKDLREELEAIYAAAGRLTPEVVLDVARDPAHALHPRFEWDDAIAGEAWRREQAHELIRSVRTVYRDANGAEKSVRTYHAVRSDAEPGNGGFVYEPAEVVIGNPFYRELVLRDMERDWKTLRARYEDFQEFWELVRGAVA